MRGFVSWQTFWSIVYHPFSHMYFSIFQMIKMYPFYSAEFINSILYYATKRKRKNIEKKYLNSNHNKNTNTYKNTNTILSI